MLFNSLPFLIFFIVVTVLYFVLEHRYRWLLLLLASCVFYMFFKPEYILILGFTIVVDYFVGIFLERIANPVHRKWFLVGSVIANVGILAVFKYFNFINDNVTGIMSMLGYSNPMPYLHIILPIGLSFHTFQAMSYTIEVYRGNQKAERHFGYYALYVMYYPQLVAGPIERPQNLLHQFHEEHFFDHARVVDGLRQMLWGFFKKIVIADTLAYSVNEYYSQCFTTGDNSLLPILFFSFQIYCDFSGYSDIALGASKVMGITLMKNFDTPYFSRTVTEFWRRWHISLSSWFRDYVFIPLGGSQGISSNKVYRNIMVVFLLSGLWHGASWTFIFWGMLHGFMLIIERITGLHKGKYVVQGVFTFLLVSVAWVFFRAENFSVAIQVLKNLSYPHLIIDFRHVFSLMLIFFLLFIEYAVRLRQCNTIFDIVKYRWVRYLSYIMMIDFIFYAFNKLGSQEFIYFQF